MSCWRLPALLLSCTSLAVLAGALAMLRALLLSYMFLTMLAGALVMPWVLLLSYTLDDAGGGGSFQSGMANGPNSAVRSPCAQGEEA